MLELLDMSSSDAAPKLFEFYSIICDHGNLLNYFRNVQLLKNTRKCKDCLKEMKLSKRSSKIDKEEWKCDTCLSVESIRQNSMFERSKLPLRKQLEILYFFGIDMQIYEVETFTDISHGTIIEWYKYLRGLCREFLKRDPIMLGTTEGSIVEIDESLFGKKRKYNCGIGKQDTWVFGMKEKGTRRVQFQIVEKRNKQTLIPIKSSVERGCTIYSDCWKSYSTLNEEGFDHFTVNHSENFKAPDGTCRNEIEGVWSLVKLRIKSMKGVLHDKIEAILDEFTYRHRFGLSNGDVYNKLISDIAHM